MHYHVSHPANPSVDHPAHAPHSHPALQPYPDRLHVVTAISNPARYQTRYRLYRAFEKHVADAGAILTTVELAFGGRPFEVTDQGNPQHLQLRTDDELWYKENLLNLGIGRLPATARYVAIVDADFTFLRADWAQETLQQLQHHPAVQMFSEVGYTGPGSEMHHVATGFAEKWHRGGVFETRRGRTITREVFHHHAQGSAAHPMAACPYPGSENTYGDASRATQWGPPGGAWAYRREALNAVGGLMEFCILGSADWFMAAAIAGFVDQVVAEDFGATYQEAIFDWAAKAERAFRKDLGVVQGLALHHWHGKMANRRYGVRDSILKRSGFCPHRHLKRDTQGLLRLHDDGTDRFVQLRDDLRSYFRSRNEDCIAV